MAKDKAKVEDEDEVLKFVRTSLDRDKKKPLEEDISTMEFQQWTGFLEEGLKDPGFDHEAMISGLGGLENEYLRHSGLGRQGASVDEVQHLAVQAVRQAVAAAEEEERQQDGKEKKSDDDQRPIKKAKTDDSAIDTQIFEETVSQPKSEEAAIEAAIIRARPVATEKSRVFSKEEIVALDTFIEDYCKILGITENDIRQRVWGNERRKDKFWDKLQRVLPNRSRASLYKHVRRAYHVFGSRGTWTKQEDNQLAQLAKKNPGSWRLIGEEMERMPEDCRDRWRNYIKCGDKRKTNKWDGDEEERLRKAVAQAQASSEKPGINWTKVSELMDGTRSRIQCRYKWLKLVKRGRAKSDGR